MEKAKEERDKRKLQTRQLLYVAGLLILAVIIGMPQSYFRIPKEKTKDKRAQAEATVEKLRADQLKKC